MPDVNELRGMAHRDSPDRYLASELARSVMFMPDQESHDYFVMGIMTMLRGFDREHGGSNPEEFAFPERKTLTAEIIARVIERNANLVLGSGESRG